MGVRTWDTRTAAQKADDSLGDQEAIYAEQRELLAPLIDKRVRCRGRFVRHKTLEYSRKLVRTTCFQELVVYAPDGKEVDVGHFWVRHTVDMDSPDCHLREGDIVDFTAVVVPWHRPMRDGSVQTLYNLEWPRDIKVAFRATFVGHVPPRTIPQNQRQPDEPIEPDRTEEPVKIPKGDLIRASIQRLGNKLGRVPTSTEVAKDVYDTHRVNVSQPYVSEIIRAIAEETSPKVVATVGDDIPLVAAKAPDPQPIAPSPPVVAVEKVPAERIVESPRPPEIKPVATEHLDYIGMVKAVRSLIATLGGKDRVKEFVDLIG